MNVLLGLSTLALRKVVEGVCGAPGASEGTEVVVRFLAQRFTDHSQRLTNALYQANVRAWTALELALAGDSLWERCKSAVARAEDKAFAQQVRAFLDAAPLPEPAGKPEFRRTCLHELRAARTAGLLTTGTLEPRQLADQAATFTRFSEPQRLLDAEWQVVNKMSQVLSEAGYGSLARLLAQRPANGVSMLVAGARYFFRRAVEEDAQLFQGLAFAKLEHLEQQQEQGFAALQTVLAQQGRRLEELLADVQAVVVETHNAVLDLQSQIEGHGGQLRQIGEAVQKLLEQHQLQRREVRAGDSLSIRNDHERQLVKQLVARYRALPEPERRQVPALLNAVGKLEVVAGDFEAARQDFAAVATLVEDNRARAEAHVNAFQACLERRDWSAAIQEFVQAVKLDARRFALFPVGKYQPQRILGAGGFGVAFLCKHKYMDAQVVVKTLTLEDLGRDADKVFAEAQALRQLDHPSIIRLTDCGYVDPANKSRPFLVMDYFQGTTLEEHVKKHGPLAVDDLLVVSRLVAEGLQAAHSKGILHRDVKPANLLVRKDGKTWHVKLIDFGLALRQKVGKSTTNASTARQSRTLVGDSIAGTLDYAAPEQLGRRDDPVGPPADVYGWAKTCCYALFETTQPLLKHWQSLPQPLAVLLEQCLDEKPSDRPATFKDILARLERLNTPDQPVPSTFAFEEVAAPKPARYCTPSRSQRGRPLWPWFALGGLAFLAVVALAGVTVLRLRTKIGTVVVEIDRPGAEVFVDGNRVTVNSPASNEPIKIDVDEGTHQLKVSKGGFEAFTTRLCLKAGSSKHIRVRLEPLKAVAVGPARAPKERKPEPDKLGPPARPADPIKPEPEKPLPGKPVAPISPAVPVKPAAPMRYPRTTTAYYRFEEGTGTKVVNAVTGVAEGTHNAAYVPTCPVPSVPFTREPDRFALEFKGRQAVAIRQVFPFHRESGNATLEFWLKAPDQAHHAIFWSNLSRNDDRNRFHIYINPGGLLGVDYCPASGKLHSLLGREVPLLVAPDTWTHIAITRTGNTYRFYKNGRLVHTAEDKSPDLPSTEGFTISGRSDGGSGRWGFIGLIDEVRCSSTALTPEEFLNAAAPHQSRARSIPWRVLPDWPTSNGFLDLMAASRLRR